MAQIATHVSNSRRLGVTGGILLLIGAVLGAYALTSPAWAEPASSQLDAVSSQLDAASSQPSITVTVDCDGITITSTKDLSNVVVGAGVDHVKHDGLTGYTFTIPYDPTIDVVWVKSGSNESGDGPGYGQRFDIVWPECDGTTTTTAPEDTTTTTEEETTTTTADQGTATSTVVEPGTSETTTPVGVLSEALEREVALPADAAVAAETLPVTGWDTGVLLAAAVVLVSVGAGLVGASRASRSTS